MTTTSFPIVLFDGRCGFCTWSVHVAQRLVGSDAHFVPYQSADVGVYGLTEDECAAAVQFVEANGHLSAERAVAAVLQSGSWPWTWLGHVVDSPPMRPLAGAIYRWVARNRGRLWGVQPPIT